MTQRENVCDKLVGHDRTNEPRRNEILIDHRTNATKREFCCRFSTDALTPDPLPERGEREAWAFANFPRGQCFLMAKATRPVVTSVMPDPVEALLYGVCWRARLLRILPKPPINGR